MKIHASIGTTTVGVMNAFAQMSSVRPNIGTPRAAVITATRIHAIAATRTLSGPADTTGVVTYALGRLVSIGIEAVPLFIWPGSTARSMEILSARILCRKLPRMISNRCALCDWLSPVSWRVLVISWRVLVIKYGSINASDSA